MKNVIQIIQEMQQEHINEGLPAPEAKALGQAKWGKDGAMWHKIAINAGGGWVEGWTDGRTEDGVINFLEN